MVALSIRSTSFLAPEEGGGAFNTWLTGWVTDLSTVSGCLRDIYWTRTSSPGFIGTIPPSLAVRLVAGRWGRGYDTVCLFCFWFSLCDLDEKNTNEIFRAAWNEAENYFNDKWKKPNNLNKLELVAIAAYTHATPAIPPVLNKAVREQGPEYKTTFNYHSLHFFLTSAIRKLHPENCYTAYRRTTVSFTQDVLNKNMRFGHFTSSSRFPLESRLSKKVFGEKSCFVIETCFGADFSMYSKFGDAEAEILLPPYEVFKVTNVETRSSGQASTGPRQPTGRGNRRWPQRRPRPVNPPCPVPTVPPPSPRMPPHKAGPTRPPTPPPPRPRSQSG
uniref:NAD(P)(+)--arginine ADP-ribosyltransferase n=1 Tax=Oryzias latipes TaxID=8090 RepID=A0A3P9JRY3_ORYLA